MDPDELAGIVSMFGGLTRDELERACLEVVFRETGETPADGRIDSWVTDALESYHLVETEETALLIAGPSAFPMLPPGGEDLPHMLDIEERSVDREAVAERVLAELEGESPESTIALTYDIETWADVDASPLRESLEERAE